MIRVSWVATRPGKGSTVCAGCQASHAPLFPPWVVHAFQDCFENVHKGDMKVLLYPMERNMAMPGPGADGAVSALPIVTVLNQPWLPCTTRNLTNRSSQQGSPKSNHRSPVSAHCVFRADSEAAFVSEWLGGGAFPLHTGTMCASPITPLSKWWPFQAKHAILRRNYPGTASAQRSCFLWSIPVHRCTNRSGKDGQYRHIRPDTGRSCVRNTGPC